MTTDASEYKFIPYDLMKEQLVRELEPIVEAGAIPFPDISYEKGAVQISFQIPALTASMLFEAMSIVKRYIENIRITVIEDGHYGFQALNSNIFNTDSLFENIRFEFFSIISSKCIISKKGLLLQEEINAVLDIYKTIFSQIKEAPESRLKKLGAAVLSGNADAKWDYIAGYEDVKRTIKESIIMPLQNPTLYDKIAGLTRKVFESNRPKAILFEGPPGVGKTTAARVIAGEAGVPLIYVPIESIMSKWYGESSRNLSEIFDAADDMNGAIIFLDEIDSLAGSRDSNMFEATRRILSVLLRKLDGIDAVVNTITIGATNRKTDLDQALLSRFDQTIFFPLPNTAERAAIFSSYAKHLDDDKLKILGEHSSGLSGRAIKDVCEYTERRWARRLIIKQLELTPPSFEYYRHTLQNKKQDE